MKLLHGKIFAQVPHSSANLTPLLRLSPCIFSLISCFALLIFYTAVAGGGAGDRSDKEDAGVAFGFHFQGVAEDGTL